MNAHFDVQTIALILAWVGTAFWVVCFWWMHRLSSRQETMLKELHDVTKRIEQLSKDEHELLREVRQPSGLKTLNTNRASVPA